MTTQWGYGKPKDEKPFAQIDMHGRKWDLLFGEHPHSTQDNTTYARSGDGTIYSFDGHRITWAIEVEEHNYLKESELSGDEVRKGGHWLLKADGEQIAEGFCRSLESGIVQARKFKSEISDVAGGDWIVADRRAKLVGRKIFYDRTPAIITSLIVDQGCIMIEPEGKAEFAPPVWEEDPADWLSEHARSIKTEVTSPHIWWWRS
jgi:hypothetical protein